MAPMSDETRKRLQEVARKRRGVKPADLKPADILPEIDLTAEQMGLGGPGDARPDPGTAAGVVYLRWFPTELQTVIGEYVPSMKILVPAGATGWRKVPSFRADFMVRLLKNLGLEPDKYLRRARPFWYMPLAMRRRLGVDTPLGDYPYNGDGIPYMVPR